jgi:hypothetical protein
MRAKSAVFVREGAEKVEKNENNISFLVKLVYNKQMTYHSASQNNLKPESFGRPACD